MRDRLGINAHLANDPHLWEAAASLGVRYARLDLNWDSVASTPDRRYWDVMDRAVDGAIAHGFEVYGSIGYTPAWANAGAGRGIAPTSIVDWTNFVQEIGLRYREKIHLFGIWNEYEASYSSYVQYLFAPAYRTLKAINPDNRICGPEMSTAGHEWPAWLKGFLSLAGTMTDILTIHCYSGTAAQTWDKLSRPRRWYEVWRQPSVKQVVEQAGFTGPCWVTEVGIRSEPDGEEAQAQYVHGLLQRLSESAWPSGVLWYQLVDEPGVRFGLLHEDHTPKLAASVLTRWTGAGAAR